MNYISCEFLKDNPDNFREVSLNELLDNKDNTYLVCESTDEIWQYYQVKKDDTEYFVKIKKKEVIDYLDKREDRQYENN